MTTLYDLLSKEEIHGLLQPSDWKGFQAVLTTWVLITFSFALVGFFPSVLTVLVALVLIGGRHLALGILMHEACHHSLFRTKKLNDWIGSWLCAYPTWQHLARYRVHHLRHHRFAVGPKDPDLDLVSGYPTTRRSLARKILRDLSGLSGLKRIYGLLLMDFGKIQYTVSNRLIPLNQKSRTGAEVLRTGFLNLHGVILTNLLLFLILATLGHAELYLLWIGSYLTTFSLFVRVRSIAEHACTGIDLDPMKSTRTTHASPLARLTVAPHRVNFHLEHHLAMAVPYFHLPVAHQILKERGFLASAHYAQNYWDVLKIASSGQL